MSISTKKIFIISIKLERFTDFYLILNFLNFVKIFLIVCNFYYVVNKIAIIWSLWLTFQCSTFQRKQDRKNAVLARSLHNVHVQLFAEEFYPNST